MRRFPRIGSRLRTGVAARRATAARRMPPALAALAALAIAGSAAAQSQPQNVYAATQSASGPTSLNGYAKNATTGALTAASGSPTDERLDGAAMAVDALGRFLFVANPANDDISMFQIDATTGALTEVPASPFASGPYGGSPVPKTPVSLATEPSGQYLYVGYRDTSTSGGGAVGSFFIDAQHLTLVPTQQMSVTMPLESPVGLAAGPRGRNLYAGFGPSPTSGAADSGIAVYQIDAATGALSEAAEVTAGENGHAMAIDPLGRFVYLGHGHLAGFVDGWQLSPVDGLPGNATSGATLAAGEFPIAMAVESGGKFLYVWTGGGAHIYSIDQTSGDLSEVAGSPQASVLSANVAADPEGPYLYALDGAGVHAYQIDPQTGLLGERAGSPYAISGNQGARGIAITGSNPSVEPASGPYPQFDSDAVAFPDTVVTASNTIADRMVNNGSQALLIGGIAISGDNPGDFSESDNCPVQLDPGAYCTLELMFAPTAAGLRQAALAVTDNGPGGKQSVALSGTGLAAQPEVTLTPGSLTFATILAGETSAAQSVTVTNSGQATLQVSSVALAGANPQDFSVENGCTAPVAVNGSCSISVQFAPAAAGQRTAQIVIGDDAPDTPQGIALAGSATDPYTLSSTGTGSTSATVQPGQTAQYSLEVAPATGFSGSVQLQCSGAPAGATCMISPSVLEVSGGAVPFGVSVATTSAALLAPPAGPHVAPPGRWLPAAAGMLLALLAGVLAMPLARKPRAVRARPRRRARAGMALATALLAAMAIAGCSGGGGGSGTAPFAGGNPGGTSTPQGTSTLTVQATSGKVSEEIQLSLTVQ